MNSELEYALIAWLNTFDLSESTKIESFDDLFDGLALTEIMNKICPKFFDSKNLVKGASENWGLVHKNLTYFYDGLSKYYFGVLYRPFEKNSVDVLAISKEKDFTQLWSLVELVIGAIIQCEQKELYINAILYLEEQYQTQLMHLIKKIIDKTKIKETTEVRDVEKEKKLLIKLDEVENENAILVTRLQESNEEKDKLRVKMNDMNQQCILLEEQVRNFNLKQEQFLSNAGAKDPEDFYGIIKIQEEKICDLDLYIKDLKLKHEQETFTLKEDLEIKKKKLLNIQKIENSLDYYKHKYEESLRIAERKSELEKLNEMHINKLEDFEKKINFLNAKISKYKEKISIEKNKSINFEIESSKKMTEIENLRQENHENNLRISRFETELFDKSSQIEHLNLEIQLKELKKNDAPSLGNELNDLILNMEAQNSLKKLDRKSSLKEQSFNVQKEMNFEEIELLEKENWLLIEKLKELQKETEKMKNEFMKKEAMREGLINGLLKEKEEMKEEINKMKIITVSLANKEVVMENKELKEELQTFKTSFQNINVNELEIAAKIKEELNDKNRILQEKNQEIEALNRNNLDLKSEFTKFKEEFNKDSFNKQSNELQDLQKEVKILRSLNNEEIEHKDDELRLLVAILYDLRLRYQELEKGKITVKGNKSSEMNMPKSYIRDSTPNLRKK